MTDTFEDIAVAIEGPVGRLTIRRADVGNAVRPQTLGEMCHALDMLIADPAVRAIVLRADGRHFSAGADFEFLQALPDMSASTVKSQIYDLFQGAARRLYHSPKPTMALINGAAITVGCELALACDFRIASETAFLQESWIRLGLMPPLGGLFLLPRLIGAGRAAEMVLSGRKVGAEEARQIGLVSEVATVDALEERGQVFAAELAASAPLAYAAIKQAMQRGLETSMQAEWSANLNQQAILLGTEDFREGLAAVVEKRAPCFTGA